MKKLLLFVLLLCALPAAAQETKSGRWYYDELRSVNGLNPLMTTVCFPEDLPDTFLILGFTKDFPETVKSKGLKPLPLKRELKGGDDFLIIYAYIKGVETQTLALEHEKHDRTVWYDEYHVKEKLGGGTLRDEFRISPAGRFQRRVYDVANPLTSSENYGVCEPISQ